MEKLTKKFESDIANHELEIIVEDGVNRILRFKDKSGSSIHHFYVMQTHGKLCFSGDMGDFVFRNHNADMLAWFHGNMSMGYIAEKCRAGKTYNYCEEIALENIKDEVRDFCSGYLDEYFGDDQIYQNNDADSIDELSRKWAEELCEQVVEEIDFENEWTLHATANDLSIKITDSLVFEIDTSEGVACRKATYHFLWCVLAMNKVAELYFTAKEETDHGHN